MFSPWFSPLELEKNDPGTGWCENIWHVAEYMQQVNYVWYIYIYVYISMLSYTYSVWIWLEYIWIRSIHWNESCQVLSVIAQQILCIQNAIRVRLTQPGGMNGVQKSVKFGVPLYKHFQIRWIPWLYHDCIIIVSFPARSSDPKGPQLVSWRSRKLCQEKKTHFEFEGTELPIIWTCNCLGPQGLGTGICAGDQVGL
jgi:hypothetical protein